MAAAPLVLPLPALRTTPSSYHRILSPDVRIPDNRAQAIPVGLLACQRDPLLRELQSSVVSCRVHQPPAETNANTASRRKAISTAKNSSVLLEVVLHDTVLFPEGGGQPSDTGVLRLSDGTALDVVEVRRHGGIAVHYVRVQDGLNLGHEMGVGADVTAALDDAGLARRLDHMCMHTSQHLLSAVLETDLALATLSWALTAYPTPSYVELPRSLTAAEITRVQAITHAHAYEGCNVHVEVESLVRDGPNTNHPRVEIHESGRTIGKALPEDYTGGVKRVVVIDGVDRNPQMLWHAPSFSAQLANFPVPQTESLARGGTSTSRLYFLSGPRLHEHLASTHSLLTATANTLSCGPPLAPERVLQVVEERKRMTKRAEELSAELVQLVAVGLAREMESNEDHQKVYSKHYHRTDDPAEALPFLQSLSSTFNNILTSPSCDRRFILVLSSSAASQSSNSISTILINSSDTRLVQAVGDDLKTHLGVKGGGKGTRWSGKRIGVWKEAKEGIVVTEILDQLSLHGSPNP